MYLTKRNIKIKLQQGKAVIMLFLFLFALTANAQQRTGQTRKTTVVRKTTAPQKRTTTVVRKSTTPQKQTTTVVRRTTVSTGKTTQRKTTAIRRTTGGQKGTKRKTTVVRRNVTQKTNNTVKSDVKNSAGADNTETKEPPKAMVDFEAPEDTAITTLEMPKQLIIPIKLDSLFQAKMNNKFIHRIDSILHTEKGQERVLAGIKKIIHIDSVLTARYKRFDADKNYVIRPPQRITLKATYTASGTSISSDGYQADGTKSKTWLNSDYRSTVSMSATYRGITLGLSLSPSQLFRHNSDYELGITNYGNRFGGDLIYNRVKSLKGHADLDDVRYNIPSGHVKQDMVTGNLYYVFNYRKFSYAAAFSQSFIQRRTAGSFLLGMSLLHRETSGNVDIDDNSSHISIHTSSIGVGAGYGFNWVPHRRWLIHLSSIPTFMLYNKNKLRQDDEERKVPQRLSQMTLTGRNAIVYSYHNKFMGLSSVYTYSRFGKRNDMEIGTIRWQVQLFWGTRLWK